MDSVRSDASVFKETTCDLLPASSRQHLVQAGPPLILLYLQLFPLVAMQMLTGGAVDVSRKEICHIQ